jgi:predicted GNAT family acetyltransferase
MVRPAPTVSVEIRPLRRGDASGLQERCFTAMTPEDVAQRVEQDLIRQRNRLGLCLVAEADGALVATALLVCRERRVGQVCNVVVYEPFRGTGLLGRLMNELANAAAELGVKRLRLAAEAANLAAIKAYARLGFRQTEIEQDVVWFERRL